MLLYLPLRHFITLAIAIVTPSACVRVFRQINGTVAYAAQRAWIQNATLRDNVLFGSPMDPERYARVLSACALTSDLDLLEAGDQTEIGEKG